ncbi:MAG TPA: permease-like cell division protein FtsX [Myxococcales bacterium]|nr:permease-like cell division protein FtsX [Myxococcales bacterium]
MRAGYLGRRALLGMRQSPFGAAVATATIALALFVAGTVAAAGTLAAQALAAWDQELTLTVYLDDGATPAQRQAVAARLGNAHFVGKAEALRQLEGSLGEAGAVLADLPQNPLRDAFELPVGGRAPEAIAGLAAEIGKLPGVVDVDYGASFFGPVERLLEFLRRTGLFLLALVGLATVILVSNTFRLAVYARRDEIAIMKLVGATDAFIRIPFLVEGLLEGLAGGLLAAAALGSGWAALWPRALAAVSLLGALGPAPLPVVRALLSLVGAGGLLGLCASGLSVGRFLEV